MAGKIAAPFGEDHRDGHSQPGWFRRTIGRWNAAPIPRAAPR